LRKLPGAPAVGLGEAAVGRALQEGLDPLQDLVVPACGDGRGADVVQFAVVAVQAEEQRREPFGLLLPADADDHAVRRLVRLYLDNALARPREVRKAEALGDHTIEPGSLETVDPLAGDRDVARRRGDRERQLLERRPPLLQRLLVQRLALPEQDVERDELRRDLGGELAHAALGRMEPHLHRVEVEAAAPLDHDLAVDRRVGREPLAERAQLREVAEQRSPVPAPERQLAAVVLEHAAEAVPLRLVLPAVAGR